MMKHILNAVRLQVQRLLSNFTPSRIGSITSYDPNLMAAVVALQPDGELTGWLPVSSPWIGNGWGMFAPPNIGDLVKVVFIDGNLNAGTVVGRYYNQQNLALPVPSGEFWLVHKLLQSLKLTNDGKIAITDGHGATITMNGDGTITSAASAWNHTGNVSITGTLAATVDVTAGDISLKTHPHIVPNVQTGGSDITSDPPSP